MILYKSCQVSLYVECYYILFEHYNTFNESNIHFQIHLITLAAQMVFMLLLQFALFELSIGVILEHINGISRLGCKV